MAATDVTESAIADILSLIEATPQRLASAVRFQDSRLAQSSSSDEWSPLLILNHLRACEEVWMHSVYTMLAHDNPRLAEVHPRQWIKTPNPYMSQSFSTGLQVFTLRRQAALIALRALSIADWQRDGHITQKTYTVFSRVQGMGQHENEHCNQIDAILKDLS